MRAPIVFLVVHRDLQRYEGRGRGCHDSHFFHVYGNFHLDRVAAALDLHHHQGRDSGLRSCSAAESVRP
jgi:hypothetical protein